MALSAIQLAPWKFMPLPQSALPGGNGSHQQPNSSSYQNASTHAHTSPATVWGSERAEVSVGTKSPLSQPLMPNTPPDTYCTMAARVGMRMGRR